MSHTLASLAAQMCLMQSAAANSRICLPSGEVGGGVNARVFVHREQRRFADSVTRVFLGVFVQGLGSPPGAGLRFGAQKA